jgi:hypothetical protein
VEDAPAGRRDHVVSTTQGGSLDSDPSDPSTFLTEGLSEVLDEHFSLVTSFWTRSGLREKAEQGYILGRVPWGYKRVAGSTSEIEPDGKRAEYVKRLYAIYRSGKHSDRDIAQWLNDQGERTLAETLSPKTPSGRSSGTPSMPVMWAGEGRRKG